MKKIISSAFTLVLFCALSVTSLVSASPKGHGGEHGERKAERHHKNKKNDNANGRFSEDKKTGLDRAEERMSPQGKQHSKAMKRHEREESAEKNKRSQPNLD